MLAESGEAFAEGGGGGAAWWWWVGVVVGGAVGKERGALVVTAPGSGFWIAEVEAAVVEALG